MDEASLSIPGWFTTAAEYIVAIVTVVLTAVLGLYKFRKDILDEVKEDNEKRDARIAQMHTDNKQMITDQQTQVSALTELYRMELMNVQNSISGLAKQSDIQRLDASIQTLVNSLLNRGHQ